MLESFFNDYANSVLSDSECCGAAQAFYKLPVVVSSSGLMITKHIELMYFISLVSQKLKKHADAGQLDYRVVSESMIDGSHVLVELEWLSGRNNSLLLQRNLYGLRNISGRWRICSVDVDAVGIT